MKELSEDRLNNNKDLLNISKNRLSNKNKNF